MKSVLLILLCISAALNGQHSDFGEINFKKADSIALLLKGESLRNLPVLTYKLTATLKTDVEKFRAIYTWVCTNIENDYSSYLKTVKKRKKLSENQEALLEWNDNFTPKVFENLLKHKKTACTGYAYLIRELASLAGIKCKIINGYGRTATLRLDKTSIPNHSWNAVELGNKWYLCDPTWSAGRIILEENGPRFEADYDSSYFLADPALFIKNHFPLDTDYILMPKPPTFKVFTEGPIVYKEAFGTNIIPTSPIQMHLEIVKKKQLSFVFTSSDIIENERFSLAMNTGKNIQPQVIKNGNEYTLSHTFDSSGKYDIHIMVDDVIITTYVVKVKRK